MFFILGVIALIVVTIVLAFKYFQTAKKVLDETKFENEVIKSANRIVNKNRVITCDYCGAVIDTSKEKVCGSCGGSYDKNAGWLALRKIDEEKAREEAARYKARVKTTVKTKTQVTAGRLKICVIVLTALTICFAALAICLTGKKDYAESEDPKTALSYYEPVDYAIEGDGVILEESGLKVTVGALYQNIYDPTVYKAEMIFENESGTDARIAVYCVGANGYVTSDACILGYDLLKNGSAVTRYETLFYSEFLEDCGIEALSSLSFGRMSAGSDDFDCLFEKDDVVTLKTTQAEAPVPAAPQGEVLYEDHGVRIIRSKTYRPYEEALLSQVLWIENTTDRTYALSAEGKMNEDSISVSGFYKTFVPAGMVLRCEINSYDKAYQNAEPDDEFRLVLGFECESDPAQDFKTGYLPMKMAEDE